MTLTAAIAAFKKRVEGTPVGTCPDRWTYQGVRSQPLVGAGQRRRYCVDLVESKASMASDGEPVHFFHALELRFGYSAPDATDDLAVQVLAADDYARLSCEVPQVFGQTDGLSVNDWGTGQIELIDDGEHRFFELKISCEICLPR